MKLKYLSFILYTLSFGMMFTSCSDDDSDAPLNFYSSVRLTAAGFIESNETQFSEFKTILQRSNYLSALKTYGHYTVFVPTNEAIQNYLKENGFASVDALSSATPSHVLILYRTRLISPPTWAVSCLPSI